MSQKKLLALAVGAITAGTAFAERSIIFSSFGNEGPADFLRPKPFGSNEKPWGKRNRRKLGGMKVQS